MNTALGVVLLVLAAGLTPFFPSTADVLCDNIKQMAPTLSNNTSSSPLHFSTTTFGQAPDVVYALALCRGDVDDSVCGGCMASTFNLLLNLKPPPPQQCYEAAYYYGDLCAVIYSVDDILNTTGDDSNNGDDEPFTRWNTDDITGDAQDVSLTVGLLHQLLVETAQAAAAASATPRRFATGMMGKPMKGGQIHVIRCYIRYEESRFYDSQPMVLVEPPSPAPMPTTSTVKRHMMSHFWAIPIVAVPLAAILCSIFCRSPWIRKYRKGILIYGEEELVWQGKNSEFSVFDFEQLREATNNFSKENQLGHGGFGEVYKGQFSDGLEIAVKRLASHSGQGFIEFKNEVQLIAKLQHRNLVRLLGCCSQEEEKLLVYEYLPNKSLDFFIFDENKRALLDWNKRIAIIEGIAHGLLYLHKHSRLCVIHRDLKPSNILLDREMNPKISDFGLAKIFTSSSTEGSTTRRVVGTYGYMAPEYASEGLYSIKSDVFSFGVLVLEIICGRRNSGGHKCGYFFNLLGYAWQLYKEGRWSELIDASLIPIRDSAEMMRCMNIALLCCCNAKQQNHGPGGAEAPSIFQSGEARKRRGSCCYSAKQY
ncbi:hypothetical protein HU200_052808 [Digitaria exilis]|uniref:Uncharacterized protein n=1 Tax=Digitaria exilis TaxID=1010633 RepID=A0A835ATC4_9POAL|nr:hypothetical protein HU200_052808 [Digitaria exilis]